MSYPISIRHLMAIVALMFLSVPAALAAEPGEAKFRRALDRMMESLAAESARDARLIRHAYKAHLYLLVLDKYDSMEEALFTGGLAPLPADPVRFNLAPRLDGPSPIGEKDLHHQVSYMAARPATIGALLRIASRVKSGPVEITSLVRHTEYQGALRATNANATTSVPMHTMGLAFDIGLVNTPLKTVYEIRDVLRAMRKAGEIMFIGERKQLVFHVVPHPSRLGHLTELYTHALGAPPATGSAPVVAFSPLPTRSRVSAVPNVTAEVVAVVPSSEFADEWWAADHAHGDVLIEVASGPLYDRTQAADAATAPASAAAPTVFALGLAAVLAGVTGRSRRPILLRLFHPMSEEHAG